MNKVAIIIVSLILATAVGLSGCVTLNFPEGAEQEPMPPAEAPLKPPAPVPPRPPEAPALVTHTETIRASANSDYELPIYLDYGQQLCLSFSVEGGNPEWASVMVSFSEPDGNNLFYDDLHRDPAEHAPDLSLTSMHAIRQGTFRYKAKESGFCLVTFHCCTSGRGTYVDVLVEYQKSL